MYNDQDNQIFPFSVGTGIKLGAGITTGVMLGNSLHRSMYSGKNPRLQNLAEKWHIPTAAPRMFGKNGNFSAAWASRFKSAYGGIKGIPSDFGMYLPFRRRAANEFDRAAHSVFGRKLGENAKVFKAPFGVLMGLASIKWEMEAKGDISGVATGLAKEGGGLIGARIGQTIGGMLGGPLGAGAGMLVGGAIGVMGVDWLGQMSKKGRRWSMPELGGNFRDSMESMTMRQRALNSIRTSQFNIRNSLGNEASMLHLGYY